jgi:hypothetical protein
VQVWRAARRGNQRYDRWYQESFAHRVLCFGVVYTLLWVSSALFWPLQPGRWVQVYVGLTLIALSLLGKNASRVRKRHITLEK